MSMENFKIRKISVESDSGEPQIYQVLRQLPKSPSFTREKFLKYSLALVPLFILGCSCSKDSNSNAGGVDFNMLNTEPNLSNEESNDMLKNLENQPDIKLKENFPQLSDVELNDDLPKFSENNLNDVLKNLENQPDFELSEEVPTLSENNLNDVLKNLENQKDIQLNENLPTLSENDINEFLKNLEDHNTNDLLQPQVESIPDYNRRTIRKPCTAEPVPPGYTCTCNCVRSR